VSTTQIDGSRQIKSATITTTQLAAAAGIVDGQLATPYIKADGTRAFTAAQSMGGFKLTNIADGTTSTDAASYGQMVALLNGRDDKASVRVATTGAETYTIAAGAVTQISGTTVNGVSPAVGEDILIKNAPGTSGAGVADSGASGSSSSANGIYTVSNATTNLTVARRTDADASAEVTGGLTVWVNEGTANADTGWTLFTNDAITLNTTALVFSQTGSNLVTVDSTLTKTGNQLSRAAITGNVTIASGSNSAVIPASTVTLAMQANLAANSVIGNLTGSGATPAAVGATAAATASTVMTRDSNGNTKANNYARGVVTTTTTAGTTTLTVASAQFQQFTGTTTQTVVLPDATTLVTGQSFIISNQSTGAVQVNANGGGGVRTVAALTSATFTLITNGVAAGTWDPGSTATPTGLTSSNFVTRETPSGLVNGSNTTYTLANTPLSGTEHFYWNGLLMEAGAGADYTISGNTITALSAPISGDKLRISYLK
jgi:hypothetical protein